MQWLLADEKWLKENQKLAGKIFKVVAEADRLVTKDPHAGALAAHEQAQLPVAATEKAIGEISFKARALTSKDVDSSRKIADFLRQRNLIKSAPDLNSVLLRGWYDRYAR